MYKLDPNYANKFNKIDNIKEESLLFKDPNQKEFIDNLDKSKAPKSKTDSVEKSSATNPENSQNNFNDQYTKNLALALSHFQSSDSLMVSFYKED